MTEVGGEAAIYIDPADPAGAAGRIAAALTERERWRTAGLENAARFSSEAMIDGYLRSYTAVAGGVSRYPGQPYVRFGAAHLKILHVLETLSPRYGGPVSVLLALAAAQQRAGHQVTVATTNADHPRGTYREPGWDTLAGGTVPVLLRAVEFAPLQFSRDAGQPI